MRNKQITSIISILVIIASFAVLITYFVERLSEIEFQTSEEKYGDVLSNSYEKVLVTRVIDGDTIELDTGEKVRYIGIDTPEDPGSKNAECFSLNSNLKNSELVLGKKVRMEKDVSETDRFGRLLRYVYVEDIFVNYELVRSGFAIAKEYPPDSKYSDLFRDAERMAKEDNSGIWNYCFKEGDSETPDYLDTEPLIDFLEFFDLTY